MRVTGPGGLITDVYQIFLNADVKLLVGTVILVLVLLLLIYRSPVLPFVPLVAVGFGYFVAGGILALARERARRHALRPGDLADGDPAVRRRHRLRPAAHLALPRGPAPRERRARRPGHGAGRDLGGHRRQRPHRDAGRAHAALRPVRRLPLVRAGARARRVRHAHRRAHAHAGAARPARPPRLLAARAQAGRRDDAPHLGARRRVGGRGAAGGPRAWSPPSSSCWPSAASSTARASASPRTSSPACPRARATRCSRSTSPRARWRRRRCSSRRRRRRPSSSPA